MVKRETVNILKGLDNHIYWVSAMVRLGMLKASEAGYIIEKVIEVQPHSQSAEQEKGR